VRNAERLVQVEVAHVGADVGGRTRPTCAFMFAPSMYTCPPCAWMISHTWRMDASKTPWVEGYVIISAASVSLCSAALARRSARSMLPRASDCTGTTSRPAMTALAGFVPCADVGIKQVVRCPSPRERW